MNGEVGAKTRDADGNRSVLVSAPSFDAPLQVLMPLIIPATLFSGPLKLLKDVARRICHTL